jgi:hypothetical protein
MMTSVGVDPDFNLPEPVSTDPAIFDCCARENTLGSNEHARREIPGGRTFGFQLSTRDRRKG